MLSSKLTARHLEAIFCTAEDIYPMYIAVQGSKVQQMLQGRHFLLVAMGILVMELLDDGGIFEVAFDATRQRPARPAQLTANPPRVVG